MMTSLECSSSARKRCSLAPGACASAPRSEGVTGLAMVIPGANTHPVGCPGQPPGRGGGGVTDVTAGRSCRVRLGGRLVQDEPVEPELADGLDELTEIHGLADVAVRAQPIPGHDVPLLPGRGEDDDREQAGARGGADAPQYLQPVDLGGLQVEEDELGRGGLPPGGAGAEQGNPGPGPLPGPEELVLGVV